MKAPVFASPQAILDVAAAQKRGQAIGMAAVCSANPTVLQAAMRQAQEDGGCLLIESTCNQVNQFGGYTGMSPADFGAYVRRIAGEMGFPAGRILLGGDHLGPSPWQSEAAEQAMAKAAQLVRDSVNAGYVKIHLDASMRCADDAPGALDPQLSAQRAAQLCRAAEQARAAMKTGAPGQAPVYVIGTEVPVPGGAQAGESGMKVTTPQEALDTLRLFEEVFRSQGLEGAFERTAALVVQPGVEFGDAEVHEYNRLQAQALSRAIEGAPGMVYEAHSTDYQRPAALKQMVEDHFAILKVGPQLTFAFREAVFALAEMEKEWLDERGEARLSNVVETAEAVMLTDRRYWERYYTGSAAEQAFARKYSYSDRIRYYWPHPALQQALGRLFHNLEASPPPLSLISQYLPEAYRCIREGKIGRRPVEMAQAHIQAALRGYAQACGSTDPA